MKPQPSLPMPTEANKPSSPLTEFIFGPFYKEATEQWDAWFAEYDRRLHLLFEHFGVKRDQPDSWMKLGFALAQTYVPGLRIVPPTKKRGPKNFTDSAEARQARQELLQLIAAHRRKHQGQSFQQTFKSLANPRKRANLPPYYRAKRGVSASLLKQDYQRGVEELRQGASDQELQRFIESMSALLCRPFRPTGYSPRDGLLGGQLEQPQTNNAKPPSLDK
jgi:hypothetical protein